MTSLQQMQRQALMAQLGGAPGTPPPWMANEPGGVMGGRLQMRGQRDPFDRVLDPQDPGSDPWPPPPPDPNDPDWAPPPPGPVPNPNPGRPDPPPDQPSPGPGPMPGPVPGGAGGGGGGNGGGGGGGFPEPPPFAFPPPGALDMLSALQPMLGQGAQPAGIDASAQGIDQTFLPTEPAKPPMGDPGASDVTRAATLTPGGSQGVQAAERAQFHAMGGGPAPVSAMDGGNIQDIPAMIQSLRKGRGNPLTRQALLRRL